AKKHIDVAVHVPGAERTFSIWQAARADGDRVRVSTDGQWHDPGDVAGGFAAVGVVESVTPLLGDERALVITNDGVWLLPIAVIEIAGAMARDVALDGYHVC